jgi:hypothetical protein
MDTEQVRMRDVTDPGYPASIEADSVALAADLADVRARYPDDETTGDEDR